MPHLIYGWLAVGRSVGERVVFGLVDVQLVFDLDLDVGGAVGALPSVVETSTTSQPEASTAITSVMRIFRMKGSSSPGGTHARPGSRTSPEHDDAPANSDRGVAELARFG